MKKKVLCVLLAILVSLTLFSCSKNSDSSNQSGSSKSGKEVVRILIPGLNEQKTVDPISGLVTLSRSDLEKYLEEKIPEYDINVVSIAWDGWIQKTETLISSGQVDVGFYTNQEAVPNWYQDMTPFLQSDEELNFNNLEEVLITPAVENMYYKSFNYPDSTNKIYGLPYAMGCNIIMYDTKIFDDWGVPYPTSDDTFQDLVEMAKKMTGVNPVTGKQNYGAYVYSNWAEWYALCYDAVKVYHDESGTMDIADFDVKEYVDYIKDSPEVLAFFSGLTDLVKSSPAGIATRTGAEKFLTADNDIAINFDSEGYTTSYTNYVVADKTDVTDRFKALFVPAGEKNNMEGFPEFYRLAISKNAKNSQAAWEVIKAIATTPDIINYILTNYYTSKLSVLRDVDDIEFMQIPLNKERHEYQLEHLLVTDDYWNWRTPLMSVDSETISGTITAEQAREKFYEGVLNWVNNIKARQGKN